MGYLQLQSAVQAGLDKGPGQRPSEQFFLEDLQESTSSISVSPSALSAC